MDQNLEKQMDLLQSRSNLVMRWIWTDLLISVTLSILFALSLMAVFSKDYFLGLYSFIAFLGVILLRRLMKQSYHKKLDALRSQE
jgi:hypothetical protein